MGEIGGNDFNCAFSQGKSIQELQDLVPDVVGAITNAVRVSFLAIHILQFAARAISTSYNLHLKALPTQPSDATISVIPYKT